MSASTSPPEPDPLDLAWAAGFLEGEGCFGWYWHRPGQRNGSLVINAVQKEREPLDRLREIFGVGRINQKVNRRDGKVFECWEWRVNGLAAAPVMRLLLPHMSSRRQARISESLIQHDTVQARKVVAAVRCPQGHLHAEHRGRRGNGTYYCRACQREREARRRAQV